MSRVRALIVAVIALVVVAGAAVIAGVTSMNPAHTWSVADDQSGAPAADAAITPADLADARRAAGEAGAQAGFLVTGTEELTDGTTQLRDGAATLADGAQAASDGAEQLSAGMVQLQAGVGQLGAGASEVADAVEVVADAVITVNAIKGQAVGALDRTIDDLAGVDDPDLVRARDDLLGLREQLDGVELSGTVVDELVRMRDGSREIANQLNVPGYAFHDGIYAATNGAADLNVGLNELENGAVQLRDGAGELDEGAGRVGDMAQQNKTRVDAVNRAIPVVWPSAGEEADEQAPSQALSPVVALLIAALAGLAGLGIGVAARMSAGSRRWAIVGVGTALAAIGGAVALMVLGSGLSVSAVVVGAVALALGALTAAGFAAVGISLFGLGGGAGVAALVSIVQLGVVGWVWRAATTSDVSGVAQAVSALMPLHWNTAVVTAAGNQGDSTQMWFGVVVLAVLAVIGLIVLAMGPRVAYPAEEYHADYIDAAAELGRSASVRV